MSRPEIQSMQESGSNQASFSQAVESVAGGQLATDEPAPARLVEVPYELPREFESSAAPSGSRLLAISDVVAIVISLAVLILLFHFSSHSLNTFRVSVTAVLMIPTWFVVAYVAGLYSLTELRINQSTVDDVGKVLIAVTAWSWVLLMARALFSAAPTSLLGPTLLWVFAIVMVLSCRAAVRRFARRRFMHRNEVAIIGWPSESGIVKDRIDRHPEWGISVAAELEFGKDDSAGLQSLADRVSALGLDRVMIVGGSEGLIDRTRLISLLVERGHVIDLVSAGAESIYTNSVLHDLEGLPVMSVRSSNLRSFDLRVKRAFDVVLASIGLLLLSPLFIVTALRIKFDSAGPVFFRQVRCGFDGEAFEVWKFRTMVDGAHEMRDELWEESESERDGDILFKLEEDPRLTNLGQTLRKWSIDELPQLFNVLKGDMSVVGPRPLTFEEANQAAGPFQARTSVKPGLAGPWQAYGRSSIPFADMIRLDYSYAVGWSLAEDVRLMFHTLVAVFTRRGAY